MPVGCSDQGHMQYRSRIEIVAHILRAVNGSGVTTKTAIMYKAFLSYAQMKEYLSLLTESDLLQYVEATHMFKITEKGLRFLKIFSEIDQAMNEEGSEQFVQSYAKL